MKKIRFKGIYFIYDPALGTVKESVFEHLSFIQLRSNLLCDCEMLKEAVKLKDLSLKYSVKFIINNRIDIALFSDADGIHLGKDDIPIDRARKIFRGIIGASRHTLEGARAAETAGADYIGAGPVFETMTKNTKRKPIGVEGVRKISKSVSIPVVPVGGIKIKNIIKLKGVACCAAVSSGIQAETNPAEVCGNLKELLS